MFGKFRNFYEFNLNEMRRNKILQLILVEVYFESNWFNVYSHHYFFNIKDQTNQKNNKQAIDSNYLKFRWIKINFKFINVFINV